MEHFLALAFSFPSVVFTVLLGVAIVYWMFVLIGAARIEHGAGVDADVDAGDLDAGHADAGGDADADVGHGGGDADHDGDADDAGGGGGASHGLLSALMLRKAPATIVLSSIILFSWVLSILGAEAAGSLLPGAAGTIARVALLAVAPCLALFPTSLVVRPLGRRFAMPEAAKNDDLVGKVCTIRTGTVTDRFGEATLDDGGAGVVVRVRVDAGEKLERGQQALIVGYDEKNQEFTVAPMDEILEDGAESPKRKRAGR